MILKNILELKIMKSYRIIFVQKYEIFINCTILDIYCDYILFGYIFTYNLIVD